LAPVPPEPPLPPEAPAALLPVSASADISALADLDEPLDPADLEAINADVAAAMAEVRSAQAEARAQQHEARIERAAALAEARAAAVTARAAAAEARAATPVVEDSCADDQPVSERRRADGSIVVQICRQAIVRQASRGLEQARAAVASQRDISDDLRQQILRDLDREIEQVRTPARVSASARVDGVRAVASSANGASASVATVTPVTFVSMQGAVTATVRFVGTFAGPDAPQAFSVTMPVTLVSTGAQPVMFQAGQTV
ncbi:hypothetical protein D2V17_03395, partial [Aurantiacibacter xanthus]